MGIRLLKLKRALKGLTQQDIAQELGINKKSYNFKENGKSQFTIKQAAIISRRLELTLEEMHDIFFLN